MDAATEIANHYQVLRSKGVDPGLAVGPLEQVGFGGSRQVFERGHIYHHDDTGTHFVSGSVLEAYSSRNGPLEDPLTGERLLGFPREDEEDLPKGLGRVSRFEWGAIIWRGGAHLMREPHFTRWESALGASAAVWRAAPKPIVPTGLPSQQMQPYDVPVVPLVPMFGFPVADSFVGADRIVSVLERGLMISARSGDSVAEADVDLPMIGRPAIASAGADVALPIWIRCPDDANGALITQALSGRVVLVPVSGGAPVPVWFEVASVDRRTDALAELATRDHNLHRVTARAWLLEAHCTGLVDRILYSVAILGDNRVPQIWAPHAVYAKASWSDFGFVHATDLHIARRNDRYYEGLIARGSPKAAKEHYQNFNDSFRDLIVTVNRLHAAGIVDVVIATGDLTDFGYDTDDVGGNRGGNFRFFRNLVQGWDESPDPEHRSEPLKVPIFVTPGNHDYRRNPYALYFDLNQDFGPWNIDLAERQEFSGYNLVKAEAEALQGGKKLNIDPDDAAEFLMIDEPLRGYYLELADRSSYVTTLGPHRLVMLDSRWDSGRILDLVDLAGAWISPSRAESSFLGGSPMQVGITDADLALLGRALVEAGEGLVIVGVHAPPFNQAGNHFAHYFRETQPPGASWEDEIIGHLIRSGSSSFDMPMPMGGVGGPTGFGGGSSRVQFSRVLGKEQHAGWFARRTDSFFFEGDPKDSLDNGSIERNRIALLKMCAGQGLNRPIDLMLCGHLHCNVEFRIRLGPNGKLRFFTDFYTQNPHRHNAGTRARDFYGTIMLAEDFKIPTWGIGSQCSAFLGDGARRAVRVVVRETATGAAAVPTPFHPKLAQLEVDPYPDSLATTTDVREWWAQHRPMILQTAALGPLENNQRETVDRPVDLIQPTFAGVRIGVVRENAIDKIHFVGRDQLRPGQTLPWETVTLPVSIIGTVFRPPV